MLRKTLMAAATVAMVSLAGVSAASADAWNGRGYGYGYGDNIVRDNDRFDGGYRAGFDHDGYRYWRYRHWHDYSRPYWFRGHYVERGYDRFGHASFIEINPRTGGVNGYFQF